jgi:hypothetical protein
MISGTAKRCLRLEPSWFALRLEMASSMNLQTEMRNLYVLTQSQEIGIGVLAPHCSRRVLAVLETWLNVQTSSHFAEQHAVDDSSYCTWPISCCEAVTSQPTKQITTQAVVVSTDRELLLEPKPGSHFSRRSLRAISLCRGRSKSAPWSRKSLARSSLS